jgi:two-component system, OmpR family, response regulator ChvI
MNKEKKRILVVDDEPDNTLVFKIGLEDGEFEVDAFNDPLLALSAFKPDSYDLLILDIKMPTMNGFVLYEEIKKVDDKAKVCFLTAFGEEYTEEFRKRFPSFRSTFSSSSPSSSSNISFVRKPIRIDDLVKKVNEIIR